MFTLTPEQLVERMKPLEAKLYSFVHTFTYIDDDADDLMQELRITAVSKVASYDPSTGQAGLKAWLKSILVNLGKRHRKEMAQCNEILWDGSDEADKIAELKTKRLSTLHRELHRALFEHEFDQHWMEQSRKCRKMEIAQCEITYFETELTPRQKECVAAFMQREEQVDIAKRLGISQPTVNEHLQAAFKKLRKSHEKRWGMEASSTLSSFELLMLDRYRDWE